MSNQYQEKVNASFSKKKRSQSFESKLERFANGVYDSFVSGFGEFNN